jgi:hypothetical protein
MPQSIRHPVVHTNLCFAAAFACFGLGLYWWLLGSLVPMFANTTPILDSDPITALQWTGHAALAYQLSLLLPAPTIPAIIVAAATAAVLGYAAYRFDATTARRSPVANLLAIAIALPCAPSILLFAAMTVTSLEAQLTVQGRLADTQFPVAPLYSALPAISALYVAWTLRKLRRRRAFS